MTSLSTSDVGRRIALSILLGWTLLRIDAQTQRDTSHGYVEGRIVDQTDAVVPEAKIEFRSSGSIYSAATGANGTYRIELPEGRYEITVRKPGFCYRRSPFRISPAEISTINAMLSVCAVANVLTIENGVSRSHDELKPTYTEESIAVSCGTAEKLEMLILYGVREQDADTAVYEGNRLFETVVATYDNVTVQARQIRLDRRSLYLYATGSVVIDTGGQRSEVEKATLSFDQKCELVRTN